MGMLESEHDGETPTMAHVEALMAQPSTDRVPQ